MKNSKTSNKNNIVDDFLLNKKVDNTTLSLGRLAITQSNYFNIGNESIRKANFNKELSQHALNDGYKKIIKLIADNLSKIDNINELFLHSIVTTNVSWLINSLIVKSSALKRATTASITISLIYITYTLTETNLYPNPIIFIVIFTACWIFSTITSLFD